MANWTSNLLTIEGKTKDLKRFDEQFKADHVTPVGGTISSGKSTKEELIKDIKKRYNVIDYRFVSAEEERNNPETRFPQFASDKLHYLIEMKEVVGKYSYQNFIPMGREDLLSDFYDWSVKHWGTKWDVSEIEPIIDLIENEEDPEQLTEISYQFMSPWSPPLPVFQEMVKQFPELTFTFLFREDGNRFAGIYHGENGKITDKEEVGTPEGSDDDYKLFLNKYFGDTLHQCQECDHLMEYWEYGQEYKCSECGSENVDDYN